MRLTLRTLLSWKDGMLDPNAAAELAAKIEASAAARQLAARIDDVVARPTLSATPLDATAFAAAANSTAEYLDNVMPADRIGEFEQVCFASDAQLAETAATHETLASWSREPEPALDRAARRRLLAAVQGRAATGRATAVPDDDVAPRVAIAPQSAGAGPARPRSTPTAAWFLVATAILLLVALIGVLGWSLGRPARQLAERRAATEPPAARVPPAPLIERRAVDGVVPDESRAEDAAPLRRSVESSVDPAAVAVPPIEQPAPPDVPAHPPADDLPPAAGPGLEAAAADEPLQADVVIPVGPSATAGDQRVPQGDALAIAAPAVSPSDISRSSAAPAVDGVESSAPPPAAAPVVVVGGEVLLHRPVGGDVDAWTAGPGGAEFELPADVVVPPFARPEVVVGDVRVAFSPGTRAVLSRDTDGAAALEVIFGGATVSGAGRLVLVAGGLSGAVTLAPAAPAVIEVSLHREPGAPTGSTERVARVMPDGPMLTWVPTTADGGDGTERQLSVGEALTWRSTAADAAVVEPAPLPADRLVDRRPADGIEVQAARALASRLAVGAGAVSALRDLATTPRTEQRLAAAATLALIGEFAELARIITADGPAALREKQWERLDLVAVQPTLARGPKAADAFALALAEHGPPGTADTIVRLARGVTDQDLEAGAAADLVRALESPHLAIRRYAIKNLVEISGSSGGDLLRYRADWPDEGLRAKGASWWHARLEQGRVRRAAGEH